MSIHSSDETGFTRRAAMLAGVASVASSSEAIGRLRVARSGTRSGISFPKSFLWGTATAGHQVEGNNVNSDVWALEQLPTSIGGFAERSGDACDHYHRFEDD